MSKPMSLPCPPDLYIKLNEPQACACCGKMTIHAEDIGTTLPSCSKACNGLWWQSYFERIDEEARARGILNVN